MKPLAVFFLAFFPAAFPVLGQSVISARAGVVNYFEGDVVLNGERLLRNYGAYPRVGEGGDLVTRSGRAEVLLAPNIYLRIGADSSIHMVSDDLSDTRIALTSGSAIVDSTAGDSQNSPVTLLFKGAEVRMDKPGQYRMDADPPQFRVYQGAASVKRDGSTVSLGPSQLFPLDGAPVVRKFTDGSDSLLNVWSDERHLLISSKIVDAKTITDPLLDPGPDPNSVSPLDAYLGYMPLSVQAQQTGLYGTPGAYSEPYPGAYSSLSYPYGPYEPYGQFGTLTPYFGFFGLAPGFVPGYLPAYPVWNRFPEPPADHKSGAYDHPVSVRNDDPVSTRNDNPVISSGDANYDPARCWGSWRQDWGSWRQDWGSWRRPPIGQ